MLAWGYQMSTIKTIPSPYRWVSRRAERHSTLIAKIYRGIFISTEVITWAIRVVYYLQLFATLFFLQVKNSFKVQIFCMQVKAHRIGCLNIRDPFMMHIFRDGIKGKAIKKLKLHRIKSKEPEIRSEETHLFKYIQLTF